MTKAGSPGIFQCSSTRRIAGSLRFSAWNFTTTNFKSGAGFGIRWESPIGPVKLDIARPVGDPDENSLAFYIGLGSEL